MTNRLLIGTRKGLFTAERAGREWRITDAALLGDPVSMVLEDEAGAIHAAQELGHFGCKIKRSLDGGKQWEDRAVPVYPPKPDGVEDIDPIRQTSIPWSLKTIWSLETGHADRPGELWCGTIPGGLFKSRDGGESWELVETLWNHEDRKQWVGGGADYPGIHSIFIDPRNADVVKLGVSCGGLWISEDGGHSWDCFGEGMRAAFAPPDQAYNRKIQDPHRIVQCTSAPDRVWIQHHNGIFRSTDGGRTCDEITCENPSTFGFAVVVHPGEPDTAWFVPGVKDVARYPVDGRLVVTRTRDGGQTFDVLTRGLPQEHCYDLVYRHGLDIDASGDRLAFGSTTGNAWVSEDQGESWQQISGFLPPIYCVRFI
jgi:hypothetical protein